MRRWLVAVAGVALVVPVLAGLAQPSSWATVAPSLVKVRPGVKLPMLQAAILSAARGECEATQLATSGPVRNLRVDASPLQGAKGATVSPSLYREGWIEVRTASNDDGETGLWPDALIPAKDAYAGEKRQAFPASSKGSEPLVAYVEYCVPPGTAPGLYQGSVKLSADGKEALTFPVTLKVRAFTLPATSSLPTAFGFSGLAACEGHKLSRDTAHVRELTRLYSQAALRHRISFYGMSMEPPPFTLAGGKATIDFSEYDDEVAPFLDGTAISGGARFTSTDVRLHPKARSDAEKVAYWKAFAAHLRQKGWLDRAFVYAKDEPNLSELPRVKGFAGLVHQADPGLRVLVTASQHPLLHGAADIFTPNINCLFKRPGAESFGYCWNLQPVESYAPERKAGARLWWYQSCGSHGCGRIPAFDLTSRRYFRGWPSYMVDASGPQNRAMGVLAFLHGIEGELYYGTVEAFYSEDPGKPQPPAWDSVWRFDGNGDGTLFYPGTPERIGGTTHVPVESLRLKALRDGLEDYEYLLLASKLGLHSEALAAAAALAPQAFEITADIAKWQSTREALGEALEQALKRHPEFAGAGPVQP